jgi:hypothetical protein
MLEIYKNLLRVMNRVYIPSRTCVQFTRVFSNTFVCKYMENTFVETS